MWALEEAALVRAGLGRLLGRRGLAGLERMRLSGIARMQLGCGTSTVVNITIGPGTRSCRSTPCASVDVGGADFRSSYISPSCAVLTASAQRTLTHSVCRHRSSSGFPCEASWTFISQHTSSVRRGAGVASSAHSHRRDVEAGRPGRQQASRRRRCRGRMAETETRPLRL